jgi:hypothetical protein
MIKKIYNVIPPLKGVRGMFVEANKETPPSPLKGGIAPLPHFTKKLYLCKL